VGGKTKITLLRQGKEKTVTAVLSIQPKDTANIGAKEKENSELGIQVAELSAERARQFGMDADEKGVLIVAVESGSRAEQADMQVGDLIRGINRKKVRSMKDYRSIMDSIDSKKEIIMLIMRRNEGLKAVKIAP
jgi:serine protease Do